MNSDLKTLVQKNMSDLIVAHTLELIEVSENEVLLKSGTFAIDILADREGVNMMYFDTTQTPVNGYNIFLFLLNNRRDSLVFSKNEPQVTSYAEFVESRLISLTQHIRNAGKDILSGSKDWIKIYSWPVVHPRENLASMI